MSSPRKSKKIAQIFKHNPTNGLLVWTFWVTYTDPIKFFATRWTCTSDHKVYTYDGGYLEMMDGYNKLVAGSKDTGDPYTEIEPMMTKPAIWELIKKCRARFDSSKRFKALPEDEDV